MLDVTVSSRSLEELEQVIERGLHTFVEVGLALMEIRDGKKYRERGYQTFDIYCQERWGWTERRGEYLMGAAKVARLLANTNHGSPSNERQARELARLPDEEIPSAWQDLRERHGDNITAAKVREYVTERTVPHVARGDSSNEWYTPPEYIEAARSVMGGINLDPASSDVANEVVQADEYFDVDDDGLSLAWAGKVWMNPPYSQPAMSQFCAKLVQDVTAGAVTEAIVLVNNATETEWFQSVAALASAICFPRGRIKYWQPGKQTATPLQGQAVLYIGQQTQDFIAHFAQFGLAVWR